MPKPQKSKSKKGGKGRNGVDSGSDDDGSNFADTASMGSYALSEGSTTVQDENNVDESSSEEIFESKLKDAIDLAMDKSAATRTNALKSICQGLLKRYIPSFLENRHATITDIVEKSLKRGKVGEVQAAANLSLLLGIQLIDSSEEVYKELRGSMLQMISDGTQPATSRAAVASALSGLCFIAGGELAEVVDVMKVLEAVFLVSTKESVNVSVDTLALHTACLSAWALLSTLLKPSQIFDTINSCMKVLRGLLKSSDVDLRITAGETMVLLLEAVYEYDEDYEPDDFDGLLTGLKQLATDSSKAKSKKDRKEQRSSFRDVLRGVEDGDSPSENIKFGREVLKIDSWLKKCQYDWFCKMMGAGMNQHLSVNSMLREIFELGPTLNYLEADANKLSKTQRNALNQQSFKLRSQLRGKNRDKRSSVI